jgi:hypothetical protein
MRILGLRVKTGYAIGVLVEGRRGAWAVAQRFDLPLSDASVGYARFPYHPLVEMPGEPGLEASRAAVAGVKSAAARQLRQAFAGLPPISAAAIVAGSLLDPGKIGNPHMRAHALEGCLYRSVLALALTRRKVPNEYFEEKTVRTLAAAALGCDEAELLRRVTAAGRGAFKPWRMEEKTALMGALSKLPR